MAGDKFDQLYNALKADGAVSGTREHFRQFVYAPGKQGYHNRKQLYDALHADGAVSSSSYEEFAQRLGLHAVNPKPQQQKPVQPVKKLTMKQRAQEVAAQYRKPRQQKAQQPRTATTSGTDYMQNWRLMHMRNDQMNPMQQAQASNARARMQRAQEQSARQEQQRATPISRSRITPTAKNFNETMQQLSTPEAKQARAKQQREDDARTLAQYEVEGNKFVRNDGQTEGILGNDLLELVDSSMNEAQELTRQQYQQNLDKMGGIYAPQSVKEQAFRDAQTQEQVNRQNVLMNNLSSKINEIYSQKGMQRHIAESADKLNMSVEEYVDKYVTPEIMNYAQKALTMRNQEEIMPHGALDYIAKNLSNSIIGMVVAPSVMSRDTRQRLQEGIAIADGDAEIQKVAGHKDETYRSGIGTRFASTAVNMAADSGPLAVIGAGASAAVNTGTRVLTNGLVKAGVMKAAQKLTAQQMAFKVANMTTAQKIMSGLGTRTATGALNLAGYSGVTAALNQASTGDDTSLQAIGEAGLKGAEHGAVTGAMFGVSGAIMSPWVSKFGITGMEKSTGERLLHGAQKFGATAAGLGVEAGTMMVADNVTGDKDISFGTWLEDVVMVGAFKAGEPSNFVKMGNILHHLTHNSGGNFVIGKNANGSPIAVDIRLTPDEKNELISSASGKNLMDAFVKVDRESKTAPRDPKYKTAYTDFMSDPDVSQSTKEKVNAAMGLFNTTRGKSYRSVNDVKNKQILEYTKNGTLLTRTSYKNAEERRDILYRQKTDRDNMYVLNLVGIAKLRGRQLVDDNGKVSRVAADFLQDKGYDISKDPTDPKNAELIANLQNPNHELYLDWIKYADERNQFTGVDTSINKILEKQPLKRTDEEVAKLIEYAKSLETQLFPDNKLHTEESRNQGRRAAEDNNLGTEQPNGEAVKQGLDGLRQAENNFEAAYESNDVLKIGLNKLAEDMGAKPKTDGLVDVLNALQGKGLTNPQIYGILADPSGKYIVSEEQLTPFAQYMHANEMIQGMQEATKEAIDENVNTRADQWSLHGTMNGNKMDGEQVLYVKDNEGRTLIVGSGEVAFDPTSGRAKEGVGDMLVCLDTNTRETVWIKADEVTFAGTQSVEDFKNAERLRLQMINSQPYNEAAQEQAILNASKPQQEQEAPKDSTTNGDDLTKVDTTSGEDNTTNENLAPQEQPLPSRKFADGSDVPMATDSKGRPTPDYASMTPEQSAEILTEDFGDNAEKVVDGQIKKAENALKDAEKMKVDYTAEPNDIMEQENLKNQTIEAAKKQLDHAQNIKKAMTAKKVAETVGKTEQTEGAHEAGSVAAQKFVNAPRLVGNKRTRMLPDGETKIKGHYEIVPAESLTPSHDVNNDYKKSEGFPTDAEGRTVNDRDYEHDKAAQQNTDQIARKYNGMAIEQVPVVSDEGIVYDGNGRTMAGQKAAKEGTDAEYINDLLENAENFGFTREQIEQSGIEHPRLVLVTDERLPYDAATFAKFNRNEKKTQSNTEQAVAKAKTLTSDEVGAIVAEIEGNGSLDAFFNNSKAINDLVKTLVDKGIIGQNEVAQMMDSPERLSAQGREYVKNLLLGSIFKPETIRMLGIDSTVKNKAINAIRSVMDNMKLGDYSLRDEIDQAIQLLYEARQGGNKVDTLLRTPSMFVEDAAKRYPSISQMMALALEGKVSDFRDLLDEYNRIAVARNTGEGNMFEAAPTKEELINEYLNFKKWQDYGTGHSEIEGSNDVSGVEEPQQEASGGNEPAEAERPRVEEADDLENKELESRIEVTDEETDTPSKNGPIMKQKILIDGDKEVIKVDEPNEKGEYTGSYYEYDGKKFGDLNGVLERIDDKTETSSEEMPKGTIYDRKKALLEEIEKGGIKKKDDAFQLLYKAEDLLDDYLGIPHDEWKPEPSRSNTIAGILSMARNALDRIKNEPVEPATEKQLSYLERLTSDDPTTRKLLEGVKLNKKQATWLIGNIKGLDDNLMRLHPDDIAETEKFIHDGIEYMKKLNGETSKEGGLPLLPKEEKPDPTFDPIAAAAQEFKKEHPLTEEEIMKADVDDLSKDIALDYLNGEVTDDLHRAIYESIFAKTRGQKTEPKVETPKAEPSADPMEGIKNAAEGFEKEKKAKTEKKPQQTADDAAVAASNKKVNDLWDMLKNAGKDEISASFVGLNSRQLEVLPKLVSAMAENAYLRIKRGMHNLEDVVKEMRKEFAPAAKLFKKEDVDAIYEQMMNIRYRDGEQRMSLKEWADYYEKTSPKHQENLVGDSKTAEERKMAEKKFIDVVNLQLGFKHKFNGIVELRKIAERVGLKDIKDTDLQELAETAIVKRARGIASSESTNDAVKFERIKTLYENQPSLNQRDSERVMKQQYSTPAPYAFLADMYVKGKGKVIDSALEPSAGNGMLTIGLPMDKVHVNDIDAQRLANLRRQGFKNVTSQDGTQPFKVKPVDIVITNPPFGSATTRDYDGYKISSLEGQMAINALESMKGDGRAAIIIGGNTEYAKNGSLKPKDKAFLGYLYSHYNVEDVINVDGGLYTKQGTSYPTRIILINGRRKYDPEHKVFPPVEKDARAEAVKDYDELYKRIEDDILRKRGVQKEPLGLSNRERVSDVSGDSLRQKERGGNGVTNNKEHGSGPDGFISDLGTGGSDERPMGETERTPSEHMGDNAELESGRDSDFGADRGTGSASSRLDNGGRVPEGSVARNANETSNERGAGGDRKQQGGQGRSSSSVQRTVPPREGNGLGVKKEESPKRELSTEKVKYVPQSNNPFSLNSVIPADQARATKKALEKIGDVDSFLVDELGYNDADDMHHALASEQADSVALAIHQAKQGNAFIIGDMTGIGKGRQAAAMIRFAYKQGKIPVFITAKKALFSDMYRDLKSIGNSDLRPFIWAAKDKEHSADMTDSEGKLVYQLPSDKEQERVMDYLQKNGKLPDGYDYIVTTYDSFSSGTMDYEDGKKTVRKNGKGSKNGQRKRDVLEAIAKNANVIMDESHKAGGQGGGSAYLQYVVPKLNAITFLSATYAKRPDNMPIYALRTSMNQSGMKTSELIDAIKRGGATLQEVMSQALTASGQFIRRERDMTGVTIDWKTIDNPVVVEEQREQYDSIIGLFNDIINFQRTYVGAYLDKRNDELAAIQASIKNRQGTKDLGIHNQPFASRTYNMVQQVLLSLKAREAAKSAIEHLKNGEKVVIALNNTNESQTEQYEANAEMEAPDLGVVLMKGLQGVLRYDQTDDMGNKTFGTFNIEDLGPDAVARYHEIEDNIKNASTGLSLSPIDVVRDELEAAGYRVGELTGRKTMFVKNPNGTVSKVKRTDTDKKKLALDFNTNKLDALILNRSASTGISLHDSVEYDVEHKPRTMIVVQQQPDVNEEVQMRGRIDRTGQVNRGRYEYIVSQIPSEQRLLMMFKAKLKSLDANTTSSQKSKFNDMEVSDIINKYGDKVVREYMAEHLDLYSRMADPFGWESSFGEDLSTIDPQRLIVTSGGKLGGKEAGADASKLLGRMALLRVSEQEKMLQEIGELYANEIQRLNEMGENDLEITELPLKAKALHKEVWKQGAEPGGDNAFADNTYIEKVNMAILKKPMKASEVKASQDGLTGGKTWDEYKTEKKAAVNEYFDQKIADETQKYEERAVKAATKAKEKYIKDGKKGQKDSGMSDEQIEKMSGYQYDNIYKQEKDKLNDVVKNLKAKAEMFERVLDTFDTNQTFVLPTDMNNPNELSGFGNSYGRLIDIKITDNYSPNASSVSFATLDGRRKITFPIVGKVGAGEGNIDVISAIDNMTKQAIGMGDSHLRVLNQNIDNWDRLTSNESRKNGYIVTGNLMQALVDSKDQGLGGQLVKYTTDTGEVKTGILMPDRFDPKGLTTDAPINSVTEKFELSSWHGGIDEVTSSDGEVKVKRIDNNRGNFYELRVPKSKAKGGKYFMDEDLLKLVNGNNFETRGNNMLAEFKPEQLKPVLDRLSKMGVKVQEERKTSEDEGTHFREDRGLQYSKTDTKDVKNGRIIPEDVDKNVSSQIEKRFDDEVERLYGDSSEKPNIEKEANKYATKQYIDTFKYDKKGNPIQKYEGIKSVIDSLDSKLKDIEQKYGFNRKSDINEIKSAIGTETAEGNDSRGMGGVPQGDSVRISSGKGVLSDYKETALSLAAAQRAKEYLLERFNNIRLKYGLEEGDWASKEQVERIFNDYNSDTDVKKIFDRIEGLVDVLGTKLKGEAYKKVNTEGYYYHPKNYILIDTDFLSSIQFGKQELASTICHEMLHVVTSDIINLYRKGYGDLLTESQRNAAKEVVDLYDEIKSYFDKHIGGTEPYALKNPAEIITELANPEWRKIAAQIPAQKGWLRRILNAIKKMLGFHVDTTTDLDRLDKALENVIRNLDYERFQKGAELNDEIVNKKASIPVSSHITQLSEKTGAKVNMVSSVDEITNKAAKAAIEDGRKITGWYDEKTGDVHLYMPNIHDRYTAEKTIWHEVVGHKGMRELFGDERFDKFLREVWYDLDKPENAALKKLVDEERKFNPLNIYDAIEEGIARLAEDGKGEAGFWNGIKNKVSDFLHEIGYRVAPNTKDVKYLLWLSKNLQKNPNDPYWKMRAEAVKYRLDHERMPAVVIRNGMYFDNDGKNHDYLLDLNRKDFEQATDGQVHFRTSPMTASKIEEYDKVLGTKLYAFKESTINHLQALEEAMKLESGEKDVWKDIPSAFNPLQAANRMDSVCQKISARYDINITEPLAASFERMVSAMDGKNKDEKKRNAELYMITKHGLERNRVLYVRDSIRDLRKDETTKVDVDILQKDWNATFKDLGDKLDDGTIRFDQFIEKMDEWIRHNIDADYDSEAHDYSGLTAIKKERGKNDPDYSCVDDVMNTEDKMGKELVNEFWKNKTSATDFIIDQEYYNGIKDSTMRNHLKGMFKFYIPLRKFDETTAEDIYGYITEKGDPNNYIGSIIANAKGRESLSDVNVLAQISAMAKTSILNGGKNVVKQHLLRFTQTYANGNNGNRIFLEINPWVEKHTIDGNEVWEEVTPQIPENATQEQISNIVQNFESSMQAKKENGEAKLYNRRGSLGVRFQRANDKNQHIVEVYVAGKKRLLFCQGNPRAAQAVNGLLKDSGASKTWAARNSASINRFCARANTSYNIDFMFSNMTRDLTVASANVTKEGPKYTKDFCTEYLNNLTSFRKGKEGNYWSMFSRYRNNKLDMNNDRERMFKEFMDNGGQTGFTEIKKLEDLMKEYDNLIKKGNMNGDNKALAVIKNGLNYIEVANELFENIARYSCYVTSRKAGRSIGRSIYDAKEVSGNFNKHGSGDAIKSLKTANDNKSDVVFRNALGWFNSYMKNYTMFYNAGVQGASLFARNFKRNAAGMSMVFGVIPFALGIAQALINQYRISNEDEKERGGVKDPYAELPEWKRRNNICIYWGKGNFKTIPIGIELRAFFGLGDIAMGQSIYPGLKSDTPVGYDILGQMAQLVPASDFLGHHSPSGGTTESLTDLGLAAAPTVLKPGFELVANRDWTGRPIYRGNDYLDYAPRWKRAYDSTSDVFIDINKWANMTFNDFPDPTEDMKGKDAADFITAPYIYQHLLEGYFGGAGSTVSRIVKTGYKSVTGNFDEIDPNQIPLYRVFNYKPSEGNDMQRTKSKWYNYSDELKQTEYNINQLKTNTPDVLKNIENNAKKFNFTHGKEGKAYNIWNAADSYIQKKKRQLKKVSDPEVIKSINEDINRKMQEAVDDLDKLN